MLYNSLLMKLLASCLLACALSLPAAAWQSQATAAPTTAAPQQTVKVSELPPVDVSKDWSDYGYWGFTLFLTIVGGFQAYLMWGNLRVVERQADQMERQTGILQQSITLAEKSAETARQNLDLFINRERAHLRIEILPLESLTAGPLKVSYKVALHGTTDAYVTSSCARVEITNSSEPGDDAQWFPAMNIPQVITPEHRSIEAQVAGVFPRELAAPDVEAIEVGRKFIHFRGFVNYKDVFGTERFTRVRRVWEVSPVRNPDGTRSGRWSRRGGAKDNLET